MTAEEFTEFWSSAYPDTLPINYLFRHDYPDRWVRFHSLPESKRYPEDEEDWTMLLNRQNTITQALLGTRAQLLLVTGGYEIKGSINMDIPWTETALQHFSFTALPALPLREVNSVEYGKEDCYLPIFVEVDWQWGVLNNALRDVAQDDIRFFLVSREQQCLIAPYDGGMDIIAANTEARDTLKIQFQGWLSMREDGL